MKAEQIKNFKQLPDRIKKLISEGKRMTKTELSHGFQSWSAYHLYSDSIKRDEMVRAFNDRNGTEIK